MRKLLLLILLVNGLSSCRWQTVYHQYGHTPADGWEKTDTVSFNVPEAKADGVYSEAVCLRANGAYPFQQLSLIITQEILPGTTVVTDTVDCRIFDSQGNFLGLGMNNYQYEIPFARLFIHKGQHIHTVIRHNMRREILTGIPDVGLKVERE